MKDTEYKSTYDIYKNTTTIGIIYKGSRVLSLEYYGQLSAEQLLIDKGVIK